MGATATYEQDAYRFRNDDGTETTATWKANENTDLTLLCDSNQTFRLRLELQENSSVGTARSFIIRYSKNGGAYATVTTATTDIKLVASGTVADATSTTNQLTTSAKTFTAGQFDSNGTVANVTINNTQTEMEYCLQALTAGVAHADTYAFRVYISPTTALNTYTRTATLTVVKTVTGTAAVTLAANTSAASGSEVVGTVASTLANSTSTASGGFGPSGSAAVTLANHISNSSGATGPSGTVAAQLADHTMSAVGTYGAATTSTTVGSSVHPDTLAYWESERVRLAVLRDDIEVAECL